MEQHYSVKQLAKLAGISVRALHLYDQLGLLKPAIRTNTRYRRYGEKELLRLQQILFYKELGLELKDISRILDEPGFDLLRSLEDHKKALRLKKDRINTLLKTVDKTITSLKNKTMLNADELYDGLSSEQAAAYRKEAISNYGTEVVERAENHLRKLNKDEIKVLVARQKELAQELFSVKYLHPKSPQVQELIARHYENTRKLWGTHGAADKQAATYKGLGNLYLTDERFILVGDKHDPEFALFLEMAMGYFAEGLE